MSNLDDFKKDLSSGGDDLKSAKADPVKEADPDKALKAETVGDEPAKEPETETSAPAKEPEEEKPERQEEKPEKAEKKGFSWKKARAAVQNFLWIPAILLVVMQALLVFGLITSVGTFAGYPMEPSTVTAIFDSVVEIFTSNDSAIIMPVLFYLVFAILFSIFSIVALVRLISLFIGMFGFFGKKADPEKTLAKFGKAASRVLASYGLFFELLLFGRIGSVTAGAGGKAIIVLSCVIFVVSALIWQFLNAKKPKVFDWKAEAFAFARTLLRPAAAIALAFLAIPEWFSEMMVLMAGNGMNNAQILTAVLDFTLGIVLPLVLATLVRKTLKFGAVQVGKGKKPPKNPDNLLAGGAIAWLVLAILWKVALALAPMIDGEGFGTQILFAGLKELISPALIAVGAVVLCKIAAPKKEKE